MITIDILISAILILIVLSIINIPCVYWILSKIQGDRLKDNIYIYLSKVISTATISYLLMFLELDLLNFILKQFR